MPTYEDENYIKKMKFKIKTDKVFGHLFHIGAFFCYEPDTINLFINYEDQKNMKWYKKLKYHEFYLLLCLGKIDISIGKLACIYDKLDERWL